MDRKPILTFLDRDRQTIDVDIPYSNIVWSKRYYDFGEFQIQMPVKYFNPDWAYCMLSTQDDFGIVLKHTYTSEDGMIVVSGFFAEWMLDYAHAIPRFTKSGEVVSLCYDLFNTYYDYPGGGQTDPIVMSPKAVFPIHEADSESLSGRNYVADFLGEAIGTKILKMLRDDQMSYRVQFDRYRGFCMFYVYKGQDRSVGNTRWPLIFSEAMGDLTDITVSVDMSAYANNGIITYGGDKAVEQNPGIAKYGGHVEIINRGNNATYGIYPMLVQSSIKGSNSEIVEMYEVAKDELREKMDKHDRIVNIEAQLADQSMIDGNILGDKVTLNVESMGLSMNTRIVELEYVYKDDTREVTVGFGDQRVSNLSRAIGALKS